MKNGRVGDDIDIRLMKWLRKRVKFKEMKKMLVRGTRSQLNFWNHI
jgi:hypothetical protein